MTTTEAAVAGLTALGAKTRPQAENLLASWSRRHLLTAEQRADVLAHFPAGRK